MAADHAAASALVGGSVAHGPARPSREPFFPVYDSSIVNNDLPTHDTRVDALLAVRCQLGERAAFDELIARWHKPLWRYLSRLAGDDDDARDLVQETWLRVFRGIARLREPAKLRPWLFGIARRAAVDRLRALYARVESSDAEIEQLAAPEDDVNLEEEIETLEQELAKLPIVEREALTLYYLQELSLEEIAEVVGVPTGTVKSRLFRARKLLRRELQQPGVSL